MNLSKAIKTACFLNDINQAEAARRCGFSAQQFGNFANGNNKNPKLSTVNKIAKGFDMGFYDLVLLGCEE